MYITINKKASAEITEKKSKFIADLFYVNSKEEAEEKIKEIRKKYHDAKHHCFAYSVLEDGKVLDRMSDDGEPSGTAGMPILNILNKKNLVNVVAIVTRYFGGILLGTGGLTKAYSDSVLFALENTTFSKLEEGFELEIILDYEDFQKLQYYLEKNSIFINKTEYNEKIKCIIEITNDEKNKLINLFDDGSLKIQKYNFLYKKLIKKSVDI